MDTVKKTALVPSVRGFEDKLALQKIECAGWPDAYPYLPDVSVELGHTDLSMLLRFSVSERNARAVSLESNGPVWEDSCVEFFVKTPGSDCYFNFETNCIGTALAARRRSREEFTHFTEEQLKRIVRRSSLPHEVTDLLDARWTLELEIPFDLLGLDSCPERLEANFYKCGDKTAVPHFVSWSPVFAPKPDFHRPEYFGELILLPSMDQKLLDIVSLFDIKGQITDIKPLGNGLINDTFKISTEGDGPDYVLQRINNAIFTDVELLQSNIEAVTAHLRSKGEMTLTFIPAKDGGKTYVLVDGQYWRISEFIKDSFTYEAVTAEYSRLCGKAFGGFESKLADIDAPIGESIPDFHNIELRVRQLEQAAGADAAGRLSDPEVQEILADLRSYADEMCKSERLYREGVLPKRICHCDTKVNNMLFDAEGNVKCVIDLDTLMPSFVFSDYGDFLRTAANFVAEDDPDVEKVGFNMEIFKAFTEGYLESAASFLTPVEKENLPYAACLFPYMQAVRFFADYLNGDTYYKTKYPEHNLVRTRNQVALFHSALAKVDEMKAFIDSLQ